MVQSQPTSHFFSTSQKPYCAAEPCWGEGWIGAGTRFAIKAKASILGKLRFKSPPAVTVSQAYPPPQEAVLPAMWPASHRNPARVFTGRSCSVKANTQHMHTYNTNCVATSAKQGPLGSQIFRHSLTTLFPRGMESVVAQPPSRMYYIWDVRCFGGGGPAGRYP